MDRKRHLSRGICASVIVLAMFLGAPFSVRAQTIGESISAGSQWLVQARHGWALWAFDQPIDTSGGEITPELFTPTYERDTLEAVHALLLSARPTDDFEQALYWIVNARFPTVERLGKKIEVLARAGIDVGAFNAQLTGLANIDGGFGVAAGYPSDMQSTAAALRALTATGGGSTPTAKAAVSFLLAHQSADGGFFVGDNGSSAYLTAQAMRALLPYRTTYQGISPALTKAQTFLLSKRDSTGAFGEPFETALALTALVPFVSDLSLVQNSVGVIQSIQSADGSWMDDAYTTALALQALRAYELRKGGSDTLTTGAVSGYVIKAGSTEPVTGAQVSVEERAGVSVLTNGDGYFLISNLPAGKYTLTAVKNGFIPASTVATVQAGGVTLAGNLVLAVATSTGSVAGRIYDSTDLTALAGATVTLGGSAYSVATDAAGRFAFAAVAPGNYPVSISRTGYEPVTGGATIVGGQTLTINQGLVKSGAYQDTTPGPVSGTVIDAKTGLPIVGAVFSLGSGLAATTNATGQFIIAAVPRGDYTASLSAAGYVTQNYSIAFPAGALGNLGVLSLYKTAADTAPTTLDLTGRIVDGVSGLPVNAAAVTVVETGASTTTGADGRFAFSGITQLNFTLTASATGYNTRSVSVQVSAFGQAEVVIALSPPGDNATTTTLSGTVRDATTSQPIANAQVAIPATGLTALTDASGHYTLSGVTALGFEVSVSAMGYAPATSSVTLATHGNYPLNPALQPIAQSGFQVVSVTANQNSVAANATALFTATIASSLTTTKSVIVRGEIVNGTGESIGVVAPYAPGTTTLTTDFGFTAGETKTLTVPWPVGQFAPGVYRLIVRVVDPGNVVLSIAGGQVLAEGNGETRIAESRAIDGGLSINPPVTQTGSTVPVSIAALVRNAGNVLLAGDRYRLTIVSGTSTIYSAESTGSALETGKFATIDFGGWTPTQAGDFAVAVRPVATGIGGEITGKLYVGDKASGTFAVDRTAVPEGTQTVHGKIDIQGAGSQSGGSTDPLYAFVQQAVRRGGQYVGPAVAAWEGTNKCIGCHIQPQGLFGMAHSLNKAEIDFQATGYLFNALTSSQRVDGGIYSTNYRSVFPKTQSQLAGWALGAWPDKEQSFRPMYKLAQFHHQTRSQNGNATFWTRDYDSTTEWWASDVAATTLALSTITSVLRDSLTIDLNRQRDFVLTPGIDGGEGALPYDIEFGPDGALYFPKASGGVVGRFDPQTGQMSVAARGLGTAYGVAFTPDGTMYVSGNETLWRINPDGSNQVVMRAYGSLSDVELGPDGWLYVSSLQGNTIYRFNPQTGQSEVYLAGGLLHNPYGIAFDAAGNLLIANPNGFNILKVTPDRHVTVFVDGLLVRPLYLVVLGDGEIQATVDGPYPITGYAGLLRVKPVGTTTRALTTLNPVYGHVLLGMAVSGERVFAMDYLNDSVHEVAAPSMDMAMLATYRDELPRVANYFLGNYRDDSPDNVVQAMRMIGLAQLRDTVADPALLAEIQTAIAYEDALLRGRQRADGGWGRNSGDASDPLVTALAGLAINSTAPPSSDPAVRNSVQYLLGSQAADGSWGNVNNGQTVTRMSATGVVMAYLPKALERLGGIDTDLHLSLAANVTLANPTTAPTSVTTNADGGREYLWKLPGVTDAGRTIDFALTLNDLQLNESRPVAKAAYLEFANSFTGEKLQVPLTIPAVRAASGMALTVTLEKASHLPGENVAISSSVANVSATTASGQVQLAIRPAGGSTTFATLAPVTVDNLGPGAQQVYASAWNTGTIYAGSYEVYGRLIDAQGRVLAESTAPFNIIVPAVRISTRVTTDKPLYGAWDSVTITGRVQNTAPNAALAPARAEVTVRTPSGTVLFADTRKLGQLVPGAMVDLPFSLRLVDAQGGTYPVELVLKDELTRAVLSTAITSFNVERKAIQGVTGKVIVNLATVNRGDPNVCNESARNVSASAITGLTLIHQLISVDQGAVIDEYTETVDLLPGGAIRSYFRSIASGNLAPGGYSCIIKAQHQGETRTLAFGGFRVIEPPLKIDAALNASTKGRLLVLLDAPHCAGKGDHDHKQGNDENKNRGCDQNADNHKLSAQATQPVANNTVGTSCDDGHPNPKPCNQDLDPHGPKTAPALSAQRSFLENLLKAQGLSYTITESAEVFAKEFHTGGYTQYAIFAEQEKLPETVQKELREATFSGQGLFVAGSHDARHHGLLEALGIKLIGQVDNAYAADLTDNPFTLSGRVSILQADKVLRIKRTTAERVAYYVPGGRSRDRHPDDEPDCCDHGRRYQDREQGINTRNRDEQDECSGHPDAHLDATVINTYGKGKSAFAGFDLLAVAAKEGNASLSTQVLKALIGHTTATTLTPVVRTVQPMELTLTNRGIATTATATVTLPAGAQVLDAGEGQATTNSVTFTTALALNETRTLTFWVRLPVIEGPATFDAAVTAGNPGSVVATAQYTVTVTAPTLGAVKTSLEGLLAQKASHHKDLKQALHHISEAYRNFHPDQAIPHVLKATDAIAHITDPAVVELRFAMDAWLRYAGTMVQ